MKFPKTRKNNNKIEVRVRLRCDGIYFGPGAAQLLELIETGESVREACSAMNMSYSKGWKIINTIEKQTGFDGVIRQHGGANGGKTQLSEKGKALLDAFRKVENEIKSYSQERFEYYLGENDDKKTV